MLLPVLNAVIIIIIDVINPPSLSHRIYVCSPQHYYEYIQKIEFNWPTLHITTITSISCRYGTQIFFFFYLFIASKRVRQGRMRSNKNNDDEFISHDLTRKKYTTKNRCNCFKRYSLSLMLCMGFFFCCCC